MTYFRRLSLNAESTVN